MGTPARKSILDNIATTLAKLLPPEDPPPTPVYKTSLVELQRFVQEWASTGMQSRPWLGFAPGKERYTHEPGGVIRVVLDVNIVGHIDAETHAERTEKLSDLVDDVIAVLNEDTTRGGHALMTTVVESDADDGDPDSQDSRGGSGSVLILAHVAYFRTTGAS